jgi:DnaJ-class molecular chaperone
LSPEGFLTINHANRCKKCKGEKTVTDKTRQEIFIEKGMSDRQRIVLASAGDQAVRCNVLHYTTKIDIGYVSLANLLET